MKPIKKNIQKKRIVNFDVIRGMLIVYMFVCHVFFNLLEPSSTRDLIIGSIGASTLSFAILSGLLIGFLSKKNSGKRILKRGVKLVLIFIIFNLLLFIQKEEKLDINLILRIFVFGDFGKTSLEILLPLSYLVIISNIVQKIKQKYVMLGSIALILIVTVSFNVQWYNLIILMAGVTGIIFGGFLKNYKENLQSGGVQKIYFPISILLFLLFYLLNSLISNYFISYLLSISMIIFFGIFYRVIVYNKIFLTDVFRILGFYSLFIYITHIILIKVSTLVYPNLITPSIIISTSYVFLLIIFYYLGIKVFEQFKLQRMK